MQEALNKFSSIPYTDVLADALTSNGMISVYVVVAIGCISNWLIHRVDAIRHKGLALLVAAIMYGIGLACLFAFPLEDNEDHRNIFQDFVLLVFWLNIYCWFGGTMFPPILVLWLLALATFLGLQLPYYVKLEIDGGDWGSIRNTLGLLLF